ncbi:putative lipoprotein, partial [Bacteroides fragilis str. S6R8]
SRVATIILPGLSGCVWAPVSFMGQADTLCIHFPLPAKETAKKEKSFENP